MNNRYLESALEMSPIVVARLVNLVPADRWDSKSDEGRFSLREAVAHLADWEPVLRDRLKLAIENPGATIQVFDEGQRAVDLAYSESDPIEQVDLWGDERVETIAFVRNVADWSGHILHPEIGVVTAQDMVNTLVGHDLYHIEHLSQYLVD